MNIIDMFTNLISSAGNIINFFFKSFSIVLSALFIVYSLVLLKQTRVMSRTFETKHKGLFSLVSLIQVILGVVLLIFAVLIL